MADRTKPVEDVTRAGDLLLHEFEVVIENVLAQNGTMTCTVKGSKRALTVEAVHQALLHQYNIAGKSWIKSGSIVQFSADGVGTWTRYLTDHRHRLEVRQHDAEAKSAQPTEDGKALRALLSEADSRPAPATRVPASTGNLKEEFFWFGGLDAVQHIDSRDIHLADKSIFGFPYPEEDVKGEADGKEDVT